MNKLLNSHYKKIVLTDLKIIRFKRKKTYLK